MTTKNLKKTTIQYICEPCHFKCIKAQDYNRHILTHKHINTTEYNKNTTKIQQNTKKYECECGKIYTHRASLFNHNKKCIGVNKVLPENIIVSDISNNQFEMLTNLVLELVKSNTELQKQMLEVCKNSNNNTINM